MKREAVDILKKFGFTQSQAALFYAGYIAGPTVMAELARRAGLPRTTAYYVVKELLRRGFFATKKSGKRIYYIAADSKKLIAMTRERERLIRKLASYLES